MFFPTVTRLVNLTFHEVGLGESGLLTRGFLPFFTLLYCQLTLYKTDITLRRTLGAGPKDFRLRES